MVHNKHKEPVLSPWPVMRSSAEFSTKKEITQIIVGCRTKPRSLFDLNTVELQSGNGGMNFAMNSYLTKGSKVCCCY